MRAIIVLALILPVVADQPITNKTPRWDGGYGFQIVQEYRSESELLDGDTELGDGLTERAHITHLEAVYTWDRSIRLTAKLPIVIDAEREILDENGDTITQRDRGIDALTLALPIKKYFNETDKSGSWTLAPQLRVPLDTVSDFDLIDPVWGAGLSLGYEQETSDYFVAVGISGWFLEGAEEDELGANLDLGWNFNTRGQLLLESDFHYEFNGSYTLSLGPAIYYRLSDLVHVRLEWKKDVVDFTNEIDHGNGDQIRATVGFVW